MAWDQPTENGCTVQHGDGIEGKTIAGANGAGEGWRIKEGDEQPHKSESLSEGKAAVWDVPESVQLQQFAFLLDWNANFHHGNGNHQHCQHEKCQNAGRPTEADLWV